MATSPSLSPSSDVEILVHITAPSRVSDDVVYRQLAQAYLAFQPETRTQVPLSEPQLSSQVVDPEQKQPPMQSATSPSRKVTSPIVAQSFEFTSQDLSFRSALDNRISPRLRYTPSRDVIASSSQETNVNSQASWCAPPSQISDSYPMPNQALLQVSPTRVLEQYLGRSALRRPSRASHSPCPSPSPSRSTEKRPTLLVPGQLDVPSSLPESEDLESLEIEAPGYIETKTIPVTPLATKPSNIPESSIGSTDFVVDESILEITHISSTAASDPSHRAGSEPPPAKRSKVVHLHHGDLVRSSSDAGPTPSSSSSVAMECSNSLEIRPTSPPVGIINLDPSDFISEKMEKLAKDMAHRWCPDAKRDIDPFERGYWLVDCTLWTPEDRFHAWGFIYNYLRKGQAGWGTWCRRGKNHDWIRLYCWGHVAQHMYLMLYIASRRIMKHTGARWYGPDGHLVLDVPPQANHG
ncbi:hypothetical protein B0T10DRAFT_474121 [Thelonectria olida]|uniref:Uncharacterized protein n=1 Tax=Thelonectria olida TaxID=1576542 RepID=A0A9P8WJ88_9HYPO|nr:hypothetical protein B0T10DRAFT_474121 [Thelonectria olida]